MPGLSTIVGQDIAVSRLKAAIRSDRVAHAYLFSGPAGVGKTTTARAFAKAVNCSQNDAADPRAPFEAGARPVDGDACEKCQSCRQAESGVHDDIHLVRPGVGSSEADLGDRKGSTDILIGQVRQLIHRLSLSPSMGRRKVFIVTPAESMNAQAQNALLKSLEEPPRASTLILCAEGAESMLPTIRSRCQVVPFGLVPTEVIRRYLEEQVKMDSGNAAEVAALAQGRLGRALHLAQSPDERQARSAMLDILEAALPAGLLEALQSSTRLREAAQKVPLTVDRLSGDGLEPVADRLAGRLQLQMLLDEMAVLMRDLLVLRIAEDRQAGDLLVNLGRQDSLRLLSSAASEAGLRHSLEAVLSAQDLLRRNVNPQLLVEDLMLELAACWQGTGRAKG